MSPPHKQAVADANSRIHRVESSLQACRFENGQKLDRIEAKVDALASELARFMAAVAAMANQDRDTDKRPWLARWLERVT